MNKSTAIMIHKNPDALNIAASAARMSTQQGTALQIFEKSGDREKDLKLIGKVLSSGHKSVIEHQTFSVAFNDVSVMVEQFVIEFRLASYTVKSRRYVDFSDAGFVIPESLNGDMRDLYCARMQELFDCYGRLLELGVPKEDARFVLPYCLRSNFFMTLDARELIHMICSMLYGRGTRFEEIRMLGEQLKAQFDEIYPGVIESEKKHYAIQRTEKIPTAIFEGELREGSASLIDGPTDPVKVLDTAMGFSGRFDDEDGKFLTKANMELLLHDSRPRELETLNYTFRISDISLACLTHFTRHRMQSMQIPGVLRALADGNYMMPESVSSIPEAKEIYVRAFCEQAAAANKILSMGVSMETLAYFAMSGHVMDVLLTMNARELLLFAKLRTCSRAQWEIRGVGRKMLLCLNAHAPMIFSGYGPSCAITHRCPEGKMTCGHPVHIENGEWIVRE